MDRQRLCDDSTIETFVRISEGFNLDNDELRITGLKLSDEDGLNGSPALCLLNITKVGPVEPRSGYTSEETGPETTMTSCVPVLSMNADEEDLVLL